MSSLLSFTKMHGTGNDYIYIDCTKEGLDLTPHQISKLSDRHKGIGGDGVVLILPSKKADFRMRMFNADGSEAQMCGNAVRCIAKYVIDRGLHQKSEVTLETAGGIKQLGCSIACGEVQQVRVDMGEPALSPAAIPAKLPGDRAVDCPLKDFAPDIEDTEGLHFTCVSMGNPHAVFFVEKIEDRHVFGLGPKIEHSPLFPERINVEFAEVLSRERLRMRVWERGSGETMSCGTGACALLVAAVLTGRSERKVQVELLGGELEIEWKEEDKHIYKTGPATFVFDGQVDLERINSW